MLRILVTIVLAFSFAAALRGESPWEQAGQRHWAFQPLEIVEPPCNAIDPAASPVDRFVAAKRRERGLSAVGAASRAVLLRRAYVDLIGLPPDPEAIQRFIADDTPQAFASVVESLLASPRYGERWGRHWLDVARYADTAGDNADYPVPEARLYRDYVIDSFNKDKPFDQFVREQLAGDILAAEVGGDSDAYRERIVATGFLALARRYATAPYELWHLTLEDVIDTTGRAFMGLSLRCARCHDHKFDPITARDYYALYGIFASTQFPWAGGEEFHSKKTPRQHFVPLVGPDVAVARKAAARETHDKITAEIAVAERAGDKSKAALLRNQRAPHEQALKLDAPPGMPVAYAVRETTPADAYVHIRGEPQKRGPTTPRGVPAFLAGGAPIVIPAGASGRRELAEWLTRPDHPLTARVIVNRVWQWHFGRGLVATPSNFGTRGAAPTHPELLDWLAQRFVDSGWSIKSLHREIMLSQTYQLGSAGDSANSRIDPDNSYYWRFERRRLDAEAIRDSMLWAARRLNLDRPAEHPFPPVEKWTWTQHSPFKAAYASHHRSVYLMTQRFQRHPYLALFDGPDTNTSTDVRTSAIVPSQALFFLNNPFVREQAEALAARLIEASPEEKKRVGLACLLCWSRPATPEDTEHGVAYVTRVKQTLSIDNMPANRIEQESWSSYARIMLTSNEFLHVE